ncbi:MAG: tetratricopeptide repeat protein [Gammaproteobacteria bacterium]
MTGFCGVLRRTQLALVLAALMASCAVSGDRNNEPAGSELPVPVAVPEAMPSSGGKPAAGAGQPLTGDLMYDILLAEIAGQRGDFDVSVSRYLEAAEAADDPRVAERAVQIASFARQYDIALVAARRWVALDSTNLDARKSLTALALQTGDLDEVVNQLDYLLSVSDDPEDGFRMATAILARHADRQAALKATQQLVDRYPDNAFAWMSLCRMAVVAEQLDTALAAADKALVLAPGLTTAVILKAQVLVRMERNTEATRMLQDAAAQHPNDTDLLFAYGRMLLDADDLEGAKQQFAKVVKIDPEYAGGLYSLALLELETRQYKAGEKHLKQLLKQTPDDQNAYYYLGYAEYEQGNSDTALDWYLKVDSGDYWSQALLRAAAIMVENGDVARMQDHMRVLRQKNPEQAVNYYIIEGQVLADAGLHDKAYTLYSDALAYSPDNDDLLYSRALTAEQLGRISEAEADLKKILAAKPDDVRTLNALGYTLADRTDRYEEALAYISKAFLQKPDDPAIIDSMGWVHYRLGDLEKARYYLEQAWEKNQDSEIGAHLGEVLWMSGERDEARRVFELSRQAGPDNAVLLEVLDRLKP